jgi:FkbM family methyltransferase
LIKRFLKAARAWRPLNGPATAGTRAISRLTGREFEVAIKHLPRTGMVESRLPNGAELRLWSRGDDWVSNQVFWRGWSGYEPETTPLFFDFAREADVVIDVGAFVGFFAVLAALANPGGHVFAFEPMPDNAERLRGHIELNELANVEMVRAAVSAADGEAELFHLDGDHPTSTSLVRDFMDRTDADVKSSLVPTVALDSFLEARGIGHVSLVKLDIETGEPDALRGMQRTLERDRPVIFCEVLSEEVGARLRSQLAPLGYRFYQLTDQGPRESEVILPHPYWLNYLFTVTPVEGLRSRIRSNQS